MHRYGDLKAYLDLEIESINDCNEKLMIWWYMYLGQQLQHYQHGPSRPKRSLWHHHFQLVFNVYCHSSWQAQHGNTSGRYTSTSTIYDTSLLHLIYGNDNDWFSWMCILEKSFYGVLLCGPGAVCHASHDPLCWSLAASALHRLCARTCQWSSLCRYLQLH